MDYTPRTQQVLWWLNTGALTLVALWIWHVLLFKQVVHEPLQLVAALAVAGGLAGAGLAIERRSAADDGVPRVWRRLGAEAWTVLAVTALMLLLFNTGFMRAASDGRGYFAQLHSIVFDFDLDFANDIEHFAARPEDASFPLGTALLWLPFYLLAHAWLGLVNLLGGEFPRDGFYNPYQRAVGLGTLAYGSAAIFLIATSLRRRYDLGTTNVAVLLTLLATPVVWYLTVDASMSHGVSLFSTTAFLVLWLESRGRRRAAQWAGLAALGALMVLVRPQNAIFAGVLGMEVLADLWAAYRTDDRQSLRRHLTVLLVLAVVGAGGGALLLLGAGLDPDYLSRQGLFETFKFNLQLFSPHHGLVSSSPVLLFALLGLVALMRKHASIALAFGLAIVLQILVGGATAGWNAGASFGARRFVSCALPFAFGLAAAVELGRRRPLVPVGLGAIALIGMNLALVDDARRGRLTLSDTVPFERMAGAVSSRVGNPFALPGALWFTWRHDIPLAMYDHIPARRYRNLHIDIGGPRDDVYLFGDWHSPEHSPAGSFRWAGGDEAGVFTQVRGDRYRLHLVAQPFNWPDAPLQTLRVFLGDEPLTEIVMTPEKTRYTIDIGPEQVARHYWMRIGFRFERSTAPRDVLDTEDSRRLAVRFESVELETY